MIVWRLREFGFPQANGAPPHDRLRVGTRRLPFAFAGNVTVWEAIH